MTAEAGQMKIRAMTCPALEQASAVLQYPPARNIVFDLEQHSMSFSAFHRLAVACLVFQLLTALSDTKQARAEDPTLWAKAHISEFLDLYRHFHAHPELSFEEYETAARFAKELRTAEIDVTEGVTKT